MFLKTFSFLLLIAVCVSGRSINSAGIAIMKEFEKFEPRFYIDPVGIKTIGYGYACHANDCSKIREPITKDEAIALLKKTLPKFESCVERLGQYLNDNQFSALVSLTYNIGCSNLQGSTLVKKLKARDYKAAATEFGQWRKGGGKVLPGLVRRREAERKLFCSSGGC